MKRPAPPTFDELMEAAAPLTGGMADGLTTEEWGELWNIAPARTRKVIATAIADGKMESGTVRRPCLLRPGWRSRLTVHRIKKGKK